MKRAWTWIALFACVCNAIVVSAAWYNGEPAWWFVWVSSIYFSIDTGLKCLREIGEAAQ